jgi:tRNA 2-thiouridine synthesizing protein A
MRKKTIDKILDVRGLPCPTPMVMTGNTLRDMKKGKTLQIITNDMTTKETIPSLCAKEGYELIEVKEEHGLLSYFVCK